MSSNDNIFFSYTNRSYEESRQEGISKIPVYSNQTWTDTNSGDPGVIILDYVHALVDMIQYYQDHNALETYLSTAKERKNIFRLAKQLGYEIRSSKGATVDVTISTTSTYDTSYIIPKHTKISTVKSPIIDYLTIEDTVVYAGQKSVTIPCIQGTLNNMTYRGTGKSSLDNNGDSKDQYVMLPFIGVDISSINIKDNTNYNWTSTDYIVFSDKDEKCFEPDLQYDNKVIIKFGSGERGYCPKTTDELSINYIYNLGSKGKVGPNELVNLTLPSEGITGLDGTKITGFSVTNKKPSVGGSDAESSRDIVNNAPGVIKTNDRAVTLEDYEILAKRVSGVKEAVVYDIKNAPDLCLHYEVKVLIIPEDSESSTTALKDNVYNYLSKRCIPPIVLSVLTPNYQDIDITVNLSIENNYDEDIIKYNITTVLNKYFEDISSQLEIEIVPNELSSLINKIVGVRYVEELTPKTVIKVPKLTIARLGNVDITVSRRNS